MTVSFVSKRGWVSAMRVSEGFYCSFCVVPAFCYWFVPPCFSFTDHSRDAPTLYQSGIGATIAVSEKTIVIRSGWVSWAVSTRRELSV